MRASDIAKADGDEEKATTVDQANEKARSDKIRKEDRAQIQAATRKETQGTRKAEQPTSSTPTPKQSSATPKLMRRLRQRAMEARAMRPVLRNRPKPKVLGPKGPPASINKKPTQAGPTPEQERSGNTVALLGQLTSNQAMIASNDAQRIEQLTIAAQAAGAQLTQNQNRSSRSTGFQT